MMSPQKTNSPSYIKEEPRDEISNCDSDDDCGFSFDDFNLENIDLSSSRNTAICPQNKFLFNIIRKVLDGVEFTQEEINCMTIPERAIVDAIVAKKKKNGESKNCKKTNKKREEEKQKLFFKGALKFSEKLFFKNELAQKKKIRRKQLDRDAYYEYYWGDVARENNVDISNFFHPNKKNTSKTNAQNSSALNPGLKSLNTTYIDLILSSDKFKDDTFYYLEQVFAQEYNKSIQQKIYKMLLKLQAIADKVIAETAPQNQPQAIKQAITNYIVSNPKAKLPWTQQEVQDTKNYAIKALNRQNYFVRLSQSFI
mmetsp:Transcript_23294/g.20178  ORF Transcript_23294/g.20178 Transcript_23294/m.20178 type:complete len:311 (+) Transcript_23294:281-1213(+)